MSALASAASISRLLAGSLLVTASLRFAWAAWSYEPGPGEAAPAPAPRETATGSASVRTPAPGPRGASVKVRVSVDVGADRSDVLVDGTRRGQVPFVGDATCIAGETLVIEVVPKTGAKQRFERPCAPGSLRIP
jgi:hypothetical protein